MMEKKTGTPTCGCPKWSEKWMAMHDEKKQELQMAMHGRRLQKLPDEEEDKMLKRMKAMEEMDEEERALFIPVMMEDMDEKQLKEVLDMASEKGMTPEEQAWFLAKMKGELATEAHGMPPPCGCPKWMAMQSNQAKMKNRRLQTDKTDKHIEEEKMMKKAKVKEMLKDMDKGERVMYV